MSPLRRPNLGPVHHYGYCVESIEATVTALTERFGAGPFFRVEGVPLEHVTSRGEAAQFRHDSAFGYCGADPVELMEVNAASPAAVRERFDGSRPSLHHIAWVIPATAVEGVREGLDGRGVPEYLHAHLGDIDFTYHDASALLGHDIEVHVDCEALRGFFEMFREAADGWDGDEPLRPAG